MSREERQEESHKYIDENILNCTINLILLPFDNQFRLIEEKAVKLFTDQLDKNLLMLKIFTSKYHKLHSFS